ncbi:P-loop containing nucleoside triphosphate hydrolase protein [Trichoderma sp. SZMC 28012]
MSQSKTAESGAAAPKPHYWKSCVILIDNEFFGGKGLGLDTAVTTTIQCHKEKDNSSWMGFSIQIPFGPKIEDEGFGKCHGLDHTAGRTRIIPADTYSITIQLPTNSVVTHDELDEAMLKRLPDSTKTMCRIDVYPQDISEVVVKGYGMPFANKGNECDAFINDNGTIEGRFTLLNVLQQQSFSFIVAAPANAAMKNLFQPLPPPLRYPYGDVHIWDEARYQEMLPETKGPQFAARWKFDNDNEHLAAMTQSQVQDVMWIHNACQEIAEMTFRAYFINPQDCDPEHSRRFYVIVALNKQFLTRFENEWRRLTKTGYLKLKIFESEGDDWPAVWDARIQDAARGLDIMSRHPTDVNDFVLEVRRPSPKQVARRPDFEVAVFEDRRSATNWVSLQFDDQVKDYESKVNAVCNFDPSSRPTDEAPPKKPDEKAAEPPKKGPIPEDTKFKMALHRALLRGNGFYDVLVPKPSVSQDFAEALGQLSPDDKEGDQSKDAPAPPRRLPVVNLVNIPKEHLDALFQEALPGDRQRFAKYMSERPLGVGAITAGPGFGKTTALAVGTLGMAATLGPIYGTAPTHVATDNFAERLDRISQSVTRRRNEGKKSGDDTRARRTFVMRCFSRDDEVIAFINTLRDPHLGDKAAPNREWSIDSKWTLNLTPSFWLLMVLRSPAVRKIHEDDPKVIHEMQQQMDIRRDCERLRAVATGKISWQEYESGQMVPQRAIEEMFGHLLFSADILCTTPAMSMQEPYCNWKRMRARGIAVDEAGNISRPDLYRVWGNTMLPCLLGGDDKQLPPAVMTVDDKDIEGDHINRLAQDAKLSALEFFRASGWPIYRLRVQLRMAKGLFDTCHREVYSDLNFEYGAGSELVHHAKGRALEAYLTTRFPSLRASPAGTLKEVFVHCPGTVCYVDSVTKSKRNPDQINNALEFLCDLVKKSSISPSDVVIITPYKANVELIARRRKDPALSILSTMPPAATVDSFQGREQEIVCVVLGTTQAVGPGFTTDEQRLNVMLSRHKSGLLIFGDIKVLGEVTQEAPGKGKGKGKAIVTGARGGKSFVGRGMLGNILDDLSARRRVVTLSERKAKTAQ